MWKFDGQKAGALSSEMVCGAGFSTPGVAEATTTNDAVSEVEMIGVP